MDTTPTTIESAYVNPAPFYLILWDISSSRIAGPFESREVAESYAEDEEWVGGIGLVQLPTEFIQLP